MASNKFNDNRKTMHVKVQIFTYSCSYDLHLGDHNVSPNPDPNIIKTLSNISAVLNQKVSEALQDHSLIWWILGKQQHIAGVGGMGGSP